LTPRRRKPTAVAALFVCENPDVDQAGASSGALARSRAGPDEFPCRFNRCGPRRRPRARSRMSSRPNASERMSMRAAWIWNRGGCRPCESSPCWGCGSGGAPSAASAPNGRREGTAAEAPALRTGVPCAGRCGAVAGGLHGAQLLVRRVHGSSFTAYDAARWGERAQRVAWPEFDGLGGMDDWRVSAPASSRVGLGWGAC
jgi:hypothetical protein